MIIINYKFSLPGVVPADVLLCIFLHWMVSSSLDVFIFIGCFLFEVFFGHGFFTAVFRALFLHKFSATAACLHGHVQSRCSAGAAGARLINFFAPPPPVTAHDSRLLWHFRSSSSMPPTTWPCTDPSRLPAQTHLCSRRERSWPATG